MSDVQLLMKNGFRFPLRVMDSHHDWHYRFLIINVYSDSSETGLHFSIDLIIEAYKYSA